MDIEQLAKRTLASLRKDCDPLVVLLAAFDEAVAIRGYADTQRLDCMEALSWGYGRGWVLRDSETGRGLRLHESSRPEAKPTVRQAIDDFRAKKGKI